MPSDTTHRRVFFRSAALCASKSLCWLFLSSFWRA